MKTPHVKISHPFSKASRARALALSVCLTLLLSAVSLLHAAPQNVEAKFSSDLLAQWQSLLEEKAQRTPTQRKISSRLLFSSKIKRGLPITDKVASFRSAMEPESDGRVMVDIRAWTSGGVDIEDDLRRELESRGAEILTAVEGNIRARISLDLVEEIAARPEIISIREAAQFIVWSSGRIYPDFNTRADKLRSALPALVAKAQEIKDRDAAQSYSPAVINRSEGDTAHRAMEARNFYGYNGTGIKIGVISNGVNSLASLQSSGDLPPTVNILPGQAGTGDEGCAMLEIVYDLAPGAQLYFATAAGGIANFAKNIRDLRTAGCDIIVDDVVYLNETPYQDGQSPSVVSPFNGGLPLQAVKDVTNDGALYFSSAGNAGNKNDGTSSTWEGDFKPIVSGSLMLHDWGGGAADPTDRVTTGTAGAAILQWGDRLGGSNNDYDLIVVNAAGTSIVDLSVDIQDGNDDPIEGLGPVFSGERILVNLFSGSQRFLSLRLFGLGRLNFNTEGATFGHSAVENALSTAATFALDANGPGGIFNGTELVETFSSDGPRRFLFNADGSEITPGNVLGTGGLLRQKPDITAADGVMTAAPGPFNPFFGTSAAAPHAAAIAALLRSANSSSSLQTISANRVRTAMLSSALNIETPGVDRDSGVGIVMAMQAMQAANAIPLPEVTGASVSGKHLFVEGRFFDNGAKIFMDGAQQKTNNDAANPTTRLRGKKLAKKISSGQTVVLTVRNSSGLASRNEFRFTKP